MIGTGAGAKRWPYEVDVYASTFVGPPNVTGTTHTCSDSRAVAARTHARISNSIKLRTPKRVPSVPQAKSTPYAVADITT